MKATAFIALSTLVAAAGIPDCPGQPTDTPPPTPTPEPTPFPEFALPDGTYIIQEYSELRDECGALPSQEAVYDSVVGLDTVYVPGITYKEFDFYAFYSTIEAIKDGPHLFGETGQWVGDWWNDDGSVWCYGSGTAAMEGLVLEEGVALIQYEFYEQWHGDAECLPMFPDCSSRAEFLIYWEPGTHPPADTPTPAP